jgi:hydroxyacylglutathione hydrolase
MSQLIDAGIVSNSRVFFIKGDRTAIVDTGAPGNERKILKALRVAGIPQDNVSLIIITHAHWDHCGSVGPLKNALKVPVMAGWPDAGPMEKGENIPSTGFPGKSETRPPGPGFEGAKAKIIVKNVMSLSEYGIDACVVPTPGHTEGSISVIASNGDCATGDFLAGLLTGEHDVVEKSLNDLVHRGAKRFYPSHGPSIDTETVLKMFFQP